MKKALAVCAVVVLAACGGAAAPHHPVHSAPAACRDFRAWFLAHHGTMFQRGGDLAQLRKAVAEAPSGHLYLLLHSTFENVTCTQAHASAVNKLYTVTGMGKVTDACQSVNPS